MSNETDLEVELSRLRNELLSGLKSKKEAFKPVEGQKPEDDELERLRLEALSAKRGKQTEKKNDRPGRFRYDRETDEEDEEDDWMPESSANIDDDEDGEDENEESTSAQGPKSTELNNFHRTNYEAYRNECSRLMANESYEPAVNTDVVVDLRRLLRDKAIGQEALDHGHKSVDEFEYEPITQPIDIRDEIARKRAQFMHRAKTNHKRYQSDHNNESRKHKHIDNEDDDDDDGRGRKKLKSVVIVKVNYGKASNDQENGRGLHDDRRRLMRSTSSR